MTFNDQSLAVKISAALTVIMFIAGLINSVLSLLTFHSKELRKVGCGIYLLASSITSLLTISMLIVKFWFMVVTQMNVSVSLFILRGGCVSIEPILKLCVYLDAWLNACVAIERTVNVSKGVNFDKKKSKRVAQWIIIILPLCIMSTIIHEPLYRDLFEYQVQTYRTVEYDIGTNKSMEYDRGTNKSEEYERGTNSSEEYEIWPNKTEIYETENHVWCVTRYSLSVQNYNTVILFVHLVVPFVANLFSAVFIIFGAARQRSVIHTKQSYGEHLRKQLREHKQLLISPIILLVLASPRLIISLLSGCVTASSNMWLYLSGYFISFTPSMLIFVVFVLPSELYMKTFKESLTRWRRRLWQ